jgi:ubiquinone/menaquinone biosynthesis C-methylase UbiE
MIGVFRYVNNLRNISNKDFWTSRTVTLNKKFSSREESLKYLNWRNSQYLLYEELMPCSGFDDKIILDYGCGPGNDLVGFLEFSQPKRLVGMDISKTALQEAQERLSLHESNLTELIQIEDGAKKLPFPDNTFDYIHSSGVLHHTPNMEEILSEFYRILKPDGKIRIMVYNYNSIWLHLSVAYQKRILQKIDSDVSLEEAFKRSTDGGLAPISRCYKKEDFIKNV